MYIYELQNGSDIRGVALKDNKSKKNVNLTPEIAANIVAGFAEFLKEKTKKEKLIIAIGRDSRITGKPILEYSASYLKSLGHEVYDCGIASTPSMFMTTQDDKMKADGGIMITASHLPYERNGMKFFTKNGSLNKDDIRKVLEITDENYNHDIEYYPANIMRINYIKRYSDMLIDIIRKETKEDRPLEGSKIIVDAGNGAGGFFPINVLEPLGADIKGSLYLEPDGFFPNHEPNPENTEAVKDLQKTVLKEEADLGIIFDTDVDRAAVVDSEGNIINRNRLIALIAKIILQEHPKTYIVTDSITSKGLKEFIEKSGGIHHRFKRGYKNVIEESKKLNLEGKESWLAIETSGHCAFKENYFLDDGAYLIIKILIEFARLRKEGKNIQDLIVGYKDPLEEKELRFKILEEDFKKYGHEVIKDLEEYVSQINEWEVVEPNYEGIRINCEDPDEKGWFLLRLSLHDPKVVVNIESDVKNGVEKIENKLLGFLHNFKGLDL
ncbi:MAG: phosphomannomutase/phosphoglucomutase [Bacillota bacterium]|nr:phosphomannomutase/phosphoglucomutase [Bacillota bacterium]